MDNPEEKKSIEDQIEMIAKESCEGVYVASLVINFPINFQREHNETLNKLLNEGWLISFTITEGFKIQILLKRMF